MKNKYISKKLKYTIILNALYQRSSAYTIYDSPQMLERVGKVLIPNYDIAKFRDLCTVYNQTEFNIMHMNDDWMVEPSYIVDYANAHNIKLYPREYFHL